MIDLLESVQALLEAEGFENVYLRKLDGTTPQEAIVVRRMPSTTVNRGYDLSREVQWPFQVFVRRLSEDQAIEDCERVVGVLDNAALPSRNASYSFVSCEVYTDPQEIAEEGPYKVYEAKFTALIVPRK